ncbi:MAG: hypothetical protein Q8L09_01050 [Candidatus Moranbacteria bacterium]|nr:hypothetical protein [Candidatus Moranbacteria bacterium]
MALTFKNSTKRVQTTGTVTPDNLNLINILICPKCGEPVLGDAPGHKCGEFKRMLDKLRAFDMHNHPGVYDDMYRRLLDTYEDAKKFWREKGPGRQIEEITLQLRSRDAEDARKRMEDDPGDKDDKKDEEDPLNKSGEEPEAFQRMEGQVRFTKDAPEELKQVQATVDKLRGILDRQKARDVAADVIEKLKGGIK